MTSALPSGQGLGTTWSDRETERALELIDIEGVTHAKAAAKLHDEGFPKRTRNAVIGHLWRVRREMKDAENG